MRFDCHAKWSFIFCSQSVKGTKSGKKDRRVDPQEKRDTGCLKNIASDDTESDTLKKGELVMDFNDSLRRALKTGSVILGPNSTEKCINDGRARMIILAGNCTKEVKTKISANENLFIHTFEGSSAALGRACGKPFAVSTLAIVNPGESDILSFKRV
jgi:large subunit ribosomal protein L30e